MQYSTWEGEPEKLLSRSGKEIKENKTKEKNKNNNKKRMYITEQLIDLLYHVRSSSPH